MNRELWEVIENTVHSETTEDLSIALKKCLFVLESKNTDKRKFIKLLNEQLLNIGGAFKLDAFFNPDNNGIQKVYIHDYKNAPVIYASHMLIAINTIIEYKKRVQELIVFFDNDLGKPKTIGLNKTQVYEVICLLQSKYNIFDIINCKSDLEIFLFNNSHKDFNSLCEVFYNINNPGTYCNKYILTFASRSDEHDPYQVLVHEIGHALQVALTHDSMSIPESFIEMNKLLEVYLENNSIIAADVFADVFSMVVMNKTLLSEHNWLIARLPSKMMDLFEYYFNKLLEYALANKDELKHKKIDITWEIEAL